jgi:hypothetical protein
MRTKYQKKLLEWVDGLLKVFPDVEEHSQFEPWRTTLSSVKIEDCTLPLPSFFSESERSDLGFDAISAFERRLRQGCAYELLQQIRMSVLSYNVSLGVKINHVHGQRDNTRFARALHNIHSDTRKYACQYRGMYDALLQLGLSPTDTTFQQLKDSELWAKNTTEREGLGTKTIQDPWYWRVGTPENMTGMERNAYIEESKSLFRLCGRVTSDIHHSSPGPVVSNTGCAGSVPRRARDS